MIGVGSNLSLNPDCLRQPVSLAVRHQGESMSLKRIALAVLAFLFLCLTATLACAVALPGPSACLFVGTMDLHRLPDGSLTDSSIPGDQQRFSELTLAARARIKSKFGPVESNPVLVFFSNPKRLGPFRLNLCSCEVCGCVMAYTDR